MSTANVVDAQDLLSEELWEVIIDLLDNAQDWRNLSMTCVTFLGIVQVREKNSRLFPDVLPHVVQYLETSDVLRARRVCQRWKNAVDTMAEDQMISNHTHDLHFIDAFGPRTTFFRGQEMDEFLEEMGTHAGNPFVGKTVEINIDRVEGWSENEIEGRIVPFINVTRFLERFGRHIRKLILKGLTDGLVDDIEGVGRLVQFLRLVPNVKNIEIEYIPAVRFIDDPPPRADVIPQIVNVTPILRDLESLTFTTELERQVEVVEYCLNCIHSMCQFPQKVTFLFVKPIPENLNIFPNIREFINVMRSPLDFAKLNECRWPLELFWSIGPYDPIRSDLVFPVLERFSETLTDVYLGSQELVVEDGVSLNLPNLKLLRLQWIRNSSLDFLNELPSGCKVMMYGVGLVRPNDWIWAIDGDEDWDDDDGNSIEWDDEDEEGI